MWILFLILKNINVIYFWIWSSMIILYTFLLFLFYCLTLYSLALKDLGPFSLEKINHSYQNDSFNCGVYAALFAKALLQKSSLNIPNTQNFLKNCRKFIWTFLSTDSTSEMCYKCSMFESNSQKQWVFFNIYHIIFIFYFKKI